MEIKYDDMIVFHARSVTDTTKLSLWIIHFLTGFAVLISDMFFVTDLGVTFFLSMFLTVYALDKHTLSSVAKF